jgi:hypothetical protein
MSTGSNTNQINSGQFNFGSNGSLNGFNTNYLAGVNQSGNGVSTDFSSLFSSLNLSGGLGPSLSNNSGPAGANSQSIAIATEYAALGTNSLLNKISPTDMPAGSTYSNSALGGLTKGMSFFDALSVATSGLAGIVPLNGASGKIFASISPVMGSLAGLFGFVNAIKAVRQKDPVIAQSSPQAMEEYQIDETYS